MEDLATIVTSTLANGCLLALLSVGFVLIFRATGVVSLAQGGSMVFGAMLCNTFANLGWGLAPALILSAVLVFVLSALAFRLVFARLIGSPPFITAIATIGLATFLEALAVLVWSDQPVALAGSALSLNAINLGADFTTNQVQLFTLAVTAFLFVVIIIGLHRTPLGLRMRMVADSPRLAALNGINVSLVSVVAWGLAGLTAAVAGAAFILGSQSSPSTVYGLALSAFPAILLGGLDSVSGALAGGMIIALIQAVTTIYVGGQWSDFVSYALLLLVLLLRPNGLFGKVEVSRV
jgi:branched-chain amino acid transport system permease protein